MTGSRTPMGTHTDESLTEGVKPIAELGVKIFADGADKILDKEKCVGDVLWRPIARTGPIVTETKLRALTLVELTDLPKLIKRGKQVLLMLAPCGVCHEPKGELFKTVLNLAPSQQIVTNVVVDSVTTGQMLRGKSEAVA